MASEATAEPSLEMGFNQVVWLALVRVRLCSLSTSSPKAARDRLTLYGVCVLHYFKFTTKLLLCTRYAFIHILFFKNLSIRNVTEMLSFSKWVSE